jgi:glycosyltransferase involved in cell wall biosynthesis
MIPNTICLNPDYSTTRIVTEKVPDGIIHNPHSKLQMQLFSNLKTPQYSEGGLRTQGYFKQSYPEKPLVTVITIVFNGEKYIEKTMRSVISQTYDNIEYIIIDGSSADGTIDIVKRYGDTIDYWISEPDEGISDAFNKGIHFSTGDIIGIINAGDWYEPDTVDQVVSHVSAKQFDIAYGTMQYWDLAEKKTDLVYSNDIFLHRNMTVCHATVFVMRRCYESIGLFRKEFRCSMDYEWLLRAKVGGMTFLYINKCLANMIPGGISDRRWKYAIWEVTKAKTLYLPGKMNHIIYFVYQVIKRTTRYCIDRIGLRFITQFYHSYCSLVKRTRSNN